MYIQLLHNDLLSLAFEKVRSGDLGDVEIAGIFSGKSQNPINIALRDRKTLIVSIADLHRNGTIVFRPDFRWPQ